MGTPENGHLTVDEIADLLDPDARPRLGAEREAHAQSCDRCRQVLAMHQEQQSRLGRLGAGPGAAPGPQCPEAAEWAHLAAGLAKPERSEELLAHASQCDACGALLRATVEDFSGEMSEAELQSLEALESASPQWQRKMARGMAEASRGALLARALAWVTAPLGGRATWLRPAPAFAAALVVVAGAGWWTYRQMSANAPARLIAQAYTEQRPFDFRIAGAEHGPVRQKRGVGSAFQRPPSLLEAEARIARELKSSPDNAEWLGLRARAEMLAWDSEEAIATLTRALDLRPDDPVLMVDLSTAYAMRAEAENRAVDYGTAIEYLTRAIRAKPEFPEAVFNRAVVYERMYLYEDAIREWRQYLSLDPRGAWAEEARRRLAELEKKKEVRQTALARISADPALLLKRIESGEEVQPEPYLDIAITEWLPRRWEDAKAERALAALAARFEARHRDPWLREVLAGRRSEHLVRGLAALAAAVKANQAEETEKALGIAQEAERRLKAGGDRAGALRAAAEQVYALHLAYRPAPCLEQAAAVERQAVVAHYSWIVGQARLELGICRNVIGDSGGAHRDMAHALERVRQAGFRILELRAAGVLAGAQTTAGNILVAWNMGRDGLATFWSGSYPGNRAHQIYFNLVRAAESLELRQTAYAFAQAAVVAIAETPHRRTEALNRARVARLAEAAGLPEEARSEYERAGRLFDRLDQTKTVREYRMYAELDRAEGEAAAGTVDAALKRLEVVRQEPDIDSTLVRIRLQQGLGEALRRMGKLQDAEAAYRGAIQLSEDRLSSFREVGDRAGAVLAVGKAYRGLVEVQWGRAGDVTGALRVWEWFRAGEWPRPREELDLKRSLGALRNETFVTYATLPGGMVAWISDDRGVEGRRLVVKPEELAAVASRFLRQCADPASSSQALHRGARVLYDWLVAPIAHRLDPARTLVVELDGAVAAIPMQALLDEHSRYLGERFAISVASGLVDYQQRAAVGPVKSSAKALVVAGPTLGKEMGRAFPPLAQALREGRMISARFTGSMLLAEKEATLSAVERELPETELFHFAGHGFSNAENGGLLLAPGEGSSGADVLDGKRLAGQRWNRCRLAVLSACSTGTGESRGPVNPESLVRRLLWAGVARVVASRWNVDAETSVLLIDGFYEALLSGADVAAALQHSARRVRENKATSHPYYWAGFQSFGSR